MANNTNGKPVAEIRVGRITATIWQNTPTDEGVFYSVHITRLFRRGGTAPRRGLLSAGERRPAARWRIVCRTGRSPPRRPNVAGCSGSPARSAASGLPSAAAAVARIPRSSGPSGRWSGPHAHVRTKSGAPTPFKRSYNNSEHVAADLASNHIGRRSEYTRTSCARRVPGWRVVSAIIASVLLAITGIRRLLADGSHPVIVGHPLAT